MLVALVVVACRPPDTGEPHEPSVPAGTGDTSTPPVDTPQTADTGTPPTTPPPFDCDAVPAGPRPTVPLEGLHPSEDFAFDDEGHLISATGTELVKQEYPPGSVVPFASTGSDPSSMRMLATGDLVYANVDTSALYRVQMDGAQVLVTGGFGYATGIDIHPSGTVFIGDASRVKRVDPYAGTVRVVVDDQAGISGIINGVTFSADYTELFLGTDDAIYRVPVDADGTPTAPATLFWEEPVPGPLLGMGVDVCGNVYALHNGRLIRIRPDGTGVEVLMEGGLNTTNLQWGSGLGGWDTHKIYVTDRNAGRPPFYEVDVGVPSKPYGSIPR